ncbi:MAG: HAD hydrolase family protein [Alphaproteobacteria bacterium]|nr:HAD hydrolase family protein [Alphaproteobacteria bacterium]
MQFENFIFDVDGVFTDGKFYYTESGKVMKVFGDADNDALSLIKHHLHIEMVTGDKRGFSISKKRIQDDMGFPIHLVSTFERVIWLKNKFDLSKTIYMGDGIYDPLVFKEIGYSIAPNNAFYNTKQFAKFVTNANGGEGAVAEAVIHVFNTLLKIPFNIFNLNFQKGSGAWTKK